MYTSFEYVGLLARFCSILASSVSVLRGCLAGTLSMSMYAWGVTIAGLMNRRKKKPPMREQMARSVTSGYLR